MRSKTKNLTRREKALFAGLASGMSITDAARAAGYSEKWPGSAGWNALQNIKAKAPNLFDRHGLTNDAFMEKHVIPALNATEIKAFHYKGRFVYSKPLIAWGPRVQMIRLVAEMMSLIVKEQETPNAGIKVVVIDQKMRPRRPPTNVTPPQVPGLGSPTVAVAKEPAGLGAPLTSTAGAPRRLVGPDWYAKEADRDPPGPKR